MTEATVRAEALVSLRALTPTSRSASDGELLDDAEFWESVGRLVDARRAAAAEVAWRSRPQLGDAGLAFRHDDSNGVHLLTRTLRISTREAHRRIAIGGVVAPRLSLTGEEQPGRYAVVGDALRSGEVGLDSVRFITDMLDSVRRRASIEDLGTAEAALTDVARSIEPELVRVHAAVWADRIDPDGARPAEHEQHLQRSVRIGRTDEYGTTSVLTRMTAEDLAVYRAGLQAHRRGVTMTQEGADPEDLDPEWREATGDGRTLRQLDYDSFMAIFRAGVRAEEEGTGDSLATPHEVITLVTAEERADGQGGGYVEGVPGRLSVPTIERLECSGTSRRVVLGTDGLPLNFGRATRLFTAVQKKALAVRDGGCAWPGCRAPVCWCEAHHIRWYDRDGGRTDIENGVLLCSFHHHRIHSTKEWEIRLHRRQPHLVPHGWQGPPLPRHRMQQHPMRGGPPAAPPRR